MIIAVDGTAGSGKGTLAKLLAKKYNLFYLDTGKIYRRIAFNILHDNINYTNNTVLKKYLESILQNYQDLSLDDKYLMDEPVGIFASEIAKIKIIRDYLSIIQRKIVSSKQKIILDGRDIGTNILPNADFKFYINASPQTRAKRRLKQLEKGSYEEVLKDIILRDENDINRAENPLIPADDAIIIDTDTSTIENVFSRACSFISK